MISGVSAFKSSFVPGKNEGFEDHPAMSAVAVMSRIFMQKRKNEPALTAVNLLVSDLPETQARMAQIGDLDSLVLRQEPRADLTHSQPLQRGHEPGTCRRSSRPVCPGRGPRPSGGT